MDNNTNSAMGGSNMNMGNLGEKKAVGPVIGLIIILVIIVLGSIYFWTTRKADAPQNGDTAMEQDGSISTEGILSQSSSDEPDTIEADLNAFGESDINNLDSGL